MRCRPLQQGTRQLTPLVRRKKEWLQQNTPDFITKDEWPLNSPDLNPLDYHVWGAMLEKYRIHKPKPGDKAELKTVLEIIWAELPQDPITGLVSMQTAATLNINCSNNCR